MKNFLVRAFCVLFISICAVSFTACGDTNGSGGNKTPDDGNSGTSGIRTYILEAEYTDLTDVEGGGHSAEASGVNVIYGDGTDEQKAAGWSNGYFVAFTHREGVQLKFVFNASAATTGATIVLRVGSEMGELTFTPSSFSVNLNGEEIEYGNMTVAHSPLLSEMVFYDKTIATNASLKKGENILTLTVLANDLSGGVTAGPIIDCVKITTNVELTWTDFTDNPDQRGLI